MTEWVTLQELRDGAIFVTKNGTLAVKSEYFYTDENPQPQCVLVESGEYAHFEDGEETLVREIFVDVPDLSACDDQSGAIDSLRERFADLTHDIWAEWMRYMFGRCYHGQSPPWVVTIPSYLVLHWTEEAKTPYADLPEKVKDADREIADRYLTVYNGYISEMMRSSGLPYLEEAAE